MYAVPVLVSFEYLIAYFLSLQRTGIFASNNKNIKNRQYSTYFVNIRYIKLGHSSQKHDKMVPIVLYVCRSMQSTYCRASGRLWGLHF